MHTIETTIAHVLGEARKSEHGRAAELIVNDGPLRQTVIALLAGRSLGEHNSPPAASMYVLAGRVRITGQEESELSSGVLTALTHVRHGVEALEDSVMLLTTVTNQESGSHSGSSE